jgi:hypothetical protein
MFGECVHSSAGCCLLPSLPRFELRISRRRFVAWKADTTVPALSGLLVSNVTRMGIAESRPNRVLFIFRVLTTVPHPNIFSRPNHLIPFIFYGGDLTMSDSLNRSKLSAVERNFRSRIAQLASGRWFLRGNLSERSGKCGRANCRCARAELHTSLVFSSKPGWKTAPDLRPQSLAGAQQPETAYPARNRLDPMSSLVHCGIAGVLATGARRAKR